MRLLLTSLLFFAGSLNLVAHAMIVSPKDYGLLTKIIMDAAPGLTVDGFAAMPAFALVLNDAGSDWSRFDVAFRVTFGDGLGGRLSSALDRAVEGDNWFEIRARLTAAIQEILVEAELGSRPSRVPYHSAFDDFKAALILGMSLDELNELYDARAEAPPVGLKTRLEAYVADGAIEALVAKLLDDPQFLADAPEGIEFYPKASGATYDRHRLMRALIKLVHDRFGITDEERLALFPRSLRVDDGLEAIVGDREWPERAVHSFTIPAYDLKDPRRLALVEKLRNDRSYRWQFTQKFRDAAVTMANLRPRLAKFTKSEIGSWLNLLIEDFELHRQRAKVATDEARGVHTSSHAGVNLSLIPVPHREITPPPMFKAPEAPPKCHLNLTEVPVAKPNTLPKRVASILSKIYRK